MENVFLKINLLRNRFVSSSFEASGQLRSKGGQVLTNWKANEFLLVEPQINQQVNESELKAFKIVLLLQTLNMKEPLSKRPF